MLSSASGDAELLIGPRVGRRMKDGNKKSRLRERKKTSHGEQLEVLGKSRRTTRR